MEYTARAELYRPHDPAALQVEVRRLTAAGLTAMDVAAAMRLTLPQVCEMLRASGEEAAAIHQAHANAARGARALP
jgi:hypothetical protein